MLQLLSTLSLKSNGALFRDRCVLELGTGSGLVSIAAAHCGARRAIATDKDARQVAATVTGLLAAANAPACLKSVESVEHAWGTQLSKLDAFLPADVVLLADVLYFTDQATPLLKSLQYILNFPPPPSASEPSSALSASAAPSADKAAQLQPTVVLMCHKRRDGDVDSRFFRAARKQFALFLLEREFYDLPVATTAEQLAAATHPDALDPDISVFVIVKRPSASTASSAGSAAKNEARKQHAEEFKEHWLLSKLAPFMHDCSGDWDQTPAVCANTDDDDEDATSADGERAERKARQRTGSAERRAAAAKERVAPSQEHYSCVQSDELRAKKRHLHEQHSNAKPAAANAALSEPSIATANAAPTVESATESEDVGITSFVLNPLLFHQYVERVKPRAKPQRSAALASLQADDDGAP